LFGQSAALQAFLRRPADGRGHRDGRRVYVTNSLYGSLGCGVLPGRNPRLAGEDRPGPNGGLRTDPNFFLEFAGERPHQVRLEGGDSWSDSFCFT
jgi:methanethiol oxidase